MKKIRENHRRETITQESLEKIKKKHELIYRALKVEKSMVEDLEPEAAKCRNLLV